MLPDDLRVLEENKLKIISDVKENADSKSCHVFSQQYNSEFVLEIHPKNTLTRRALAIVNSIDHPNIIRIYKCFTREEKIYVLKEMCQDSLIDVLDQKLNFYQIFVDIARAVSNCHHKYIAHNNIQPSSISIDRYHRGKLSNFINPNIDCVTGKLSENFNNINPYSAPEIVQHKPYDPYAADIWSLGVLLYFMVTKTYPWKEGEEHVMTPELISKVTNPYIATMIEKCTQEDPSMRINIDDLLSLPIGPQPITPSRKKATIMLSKTNTFSKLRLTSISKHKSTSVVPHLPPLYA